MAAHYVPRKLFFTSGTGVHQEKLVSFEMALRAAQIQQFNLVTVSSILPPACEIVSIDEGLAGLSPGEIVHCVLARQASRDPGTPITVSIGLAIPASPHQYGYLSEHHACGETEQESGAYAERLAVVMLATALGYPDVDELHCSQLVGRPATHKVISNSYNITRHAIADREGRWTTAVAAAIFVP